MALANHRVRNLPNPKALEIFLTTEMIPGTITGGTQTFPFTFGGVGELLVVEGSIDGGANWNAFQRICTIGAAGPHADIAALLAELNTAARWDGGSLPTEFIISNSGDKLVFTHAVKDAGVGLRISKLSNCVGAASDEDLLVLTGVGSFGTKYGSVGLASVVSIFPDGNGQYIVVYTV